jgi:hypothetical protein
MNRKEENTPLDVTFAGAEVGLFATGSLSLVSNETAIELANASCGLRLSFNLGDVERFEPAKSFGGSPCLNLIFSEKASLLLCERA